MKNIVADNLFKGLGLQKICKMIKKTEKIARFEKNKKVFL